MTRVLVVWGNWGPYHYARFETLRQLGADLGFTVQGLELFSSSGVYGWETRANAPNVHYLDFGGDETAFRPWLFTRQLAPLILRLRPDVCFVPSYLRWSLFVNFISRIAGARIVMMNDSHGGTERAQGLKRTIKRGIISSFHAGLVAGSPHQRYFASLGLPAARIFRGYDAVDNKYFSRAAESARAAAGQIRARSGLPDRYFLSLGRIVEKKNLTLLLRAFARLQPAADGVSHHLVVVGSGHCEGELRALCAELSLPTIDHFIGREHGIASSAGEPSVHFYGFRQIDESPNFYALSTAFILPSVSEEWGLVVNEAMACGVPVLVSRTAGCAEDLVVPGDNGFQFDPDDVDALVDGLQSLIDDPDLAHRMGAASARRIDDWGCEQFAEGAIRAVRAALES